MFFSEMKLLERMIKRIIHLIQSLELINDSLEKRPVMLPCYSAAAVSNAQSSYC